ncbi:MAG: DNA-3-methyladenine glycosylase [Spirochaetia bacterium]|nr:DNA-3-methyladenine glycosylase [Spirochaetia bacterium]
MTNDLNINSLTPLSLSFYKKPTLKIAELLLGKYFVRYYKNKPLISRIVETEAYHETGDPACHAHNGKTKRNEVMFGPPAHLYVYFTYGMHYCLNVVTEKEGTAAAVLIRAIEPLQGVEVMRKLRGEKIILKNLANGPAKLCQAMDINKKTNGVSLLEKEIFIADNKSRKKFDIVKTTRIGISKGQSLPWRFYIKGNEFVSKP